MDAMDDEPDEESLFNILIATDIHLGYNERHQIRGVRLFSLGGSKFCSVVVIVSPVNCSE